MTTPTATALLTAARISVRERKTATKAIEAAEGAEWMLERCASAIINAGRSDPRSHYTVRLRRDPDDPEGQREVDPAKGTATFDVQWLNGRHEYDSIETVTFTFGELANPDETIAGRRRADERRKASERRREIAATERRLARLKGKS